MCPFCMEVLSTENLFNYECCYQCAIPLESHELEKKCCIDCAINSPYFDETHCLDRYEGRLQKALHQLKYERRLAFAHGLATAWNACTAEALQNTRARYLLPVPLSPEKLCTRGFNQSWELARRIQCHPQIEKLPYALMRYHAMQSQVTESRAKRGIAIRGMFYISDQYQSILENQTIIVFDDVMTSGATLNEIARVLKDNGASRVINWVLLRTARPAQPKAQHV